MILNYKRLNGILGWVVFGIALITYSLTVEPTVSFWDCGEYIATASNLEVGHPPGSSLFQIIGAVFSLLNFGNPENTALAINLMSAICSAFTILFLFWTITYLSRKIIGNKKESTGDIIAILGSGIVGSLAFTFSDTFWFSAVEAEVYAMSSFFCALVFWLILKWEARANNPRSDRWLVLIFFILGLSFGVHLLVLLSVPAIVAIYYFKKFPGLDIKNFLLMNVVAILVLGFAFYIVFPHTLKFFGFSEIFFVNIIGLPFHSGTIIALFLYIILFHFGLRYARRRNLHFLNTLLLCTIFLLIGTSSWLMLAIRANTNTPINENNPDTAVGLLRYYNREQYGDWPILYGEMYTAYEGGIKLVKGNEYLDGSKKYERDDKLGKYKLIDAGKNVKYNFDPAHVGFFPRMYSGKKDKIANYKRITGNTHGKKPSLYQNIKFFFQYQIGYMYLRYFMWNFAGRQNNIQGDYTITKGNWKSGISFIDEIRLGPQKEMPEFLKNNKANNSYYFIPLLFGLIGFLFHFSKDKKRFYALFLLFIFSGVAVIVYTNVKPFEPRERDYAVVNSFYVFAVWIGLGVLALHEYLKSKINSKVAAIAITLIGFFSVPVLMATENWDDHDRSNRFTARDLAKMYLDSVEENAILFVHGDNDTFPLWYVQEVEGYRTDVKVINLSLLNTDWYIDQMKRKTMKSDPIPSQLKHDQYAGRTRDVVYHYDFSGIGDTLQIKQWVDWVSSDAPETKVTDPRDPNSETIIYPAKNLIIPVNKNEILKRKIISEKEQDLIVDELNIYLNTFLIYKSSLVVFDIIANNNWERPIYFSVGGGGNPSTYAYLTDYFQLEGLAYRLVPVKTKASSYHGLGRVGTEKMYDNVMKYKWGTLNHPDIYHDDQIRNISHTMKIYLGSLALALANEKENEKAADILNILEDQFPIDIYPINTLLFPIIETYYKIGKTEKAKLFIGAFEDKITQYLTYYRSFSEKDQRLLISEISNSFRELGGLAQTIKPFDKELYKEYDSKFDEYIEEFNWMFKRKR